jgi:NTE family protein
MKSPHPYAMAGVAARTMGPAIVASGDNSVSNASHTTAFVFSGGSALGAAQVGMLRALTEAGITADLLLGTSVGALNAATFATDATMTGLDRLDRLWTSARRSQIFPLSAASVMRGMIRGRDHLVPNDGLRRWIGDHLELQRLEDSPIPLHAMATDLETGDPVMLSDGDAATALMASCAIPGFYPPVEIDGRLLIDGGVAADTPIPQARSLGAKVIYVLPTAPWAPAATPSHRVRHLGFSLLDRLFGTPAVIHDEVIDLTDAVIHVLPVATVPDANPFSFRQSRRLIDTAYSLTQAWLARDQRCRAVQPSCAAPR